MLWLEYGYFLRTWSLLCGISCIISWCLLLFPADSLRHGISFTHSGSAEEDPVTCLGITLEFPEVAAGSLQQTNFTLALSLRNKQACSDTVTGLCAAAGGKASVHIQQAGVPTRTCVPGPYFKAGLETGSHLYLFASLVSNTIWWSRIEQIPTYLFIPTYLYQL